MRSKAALWWVLLVGCSGSSAVEDVRGLSESLGQCAPPQALEGIDVFDGQGQVDWAAARSGGTAFAFIKATQGTYDTQSTFAAHWAGAGAAGVRRSAYHFFNPTEDGAAQAAHFLSVVGPLAPGDLPATLDVECPDGDPGCLYAGHPGQAPATEIRSRIGAFLDAVEQATHARPVLYTFHDYFKSSGVDAAGLEAYPLFLADPTSAACLDVPAPWSSATFWQYSWKGTVPGIVGAVDRDRFLGDGAAFARLAVPPNAPPGCR